MISPFRFRPLPLRDLLVCGGWRGLTVVACGSVLLGGCLHVSERPLAPEVTAQAFEARTFADAALQSYLREQGVKVPAGDAAWSFEALCWVAFYERADLALARAEWHSAQAAHQVAGERPNPTVTVNPGYNANPGDASPWFPSIDFDIPLTRTGKRAALMEQGERQTEARAQAVVATAWIVRTELARALIALSAAERRRAIWTDVQTTDARLLALVEARQRAGLVGAGEVSPARAALADSEGARAAAELAIAQARADVARALGLPVAALADARLPDGLAWADAPQPDLAAARTAALQTRADLRVALAEYAAAQAGLRAEVARQYPDIHLGPGYQWDQGASKWSLALSVEWPIFSRNAGAIATATAQRAEAAARFQSVQAAAVAGIDRALATVAGTDGPWRAARTGWTERQQAQALAVARLNLGATDQITVQQTRRETAVAELNVIETGAARAQARVELEAALQVPFARIETLLESNPEPAKLP